MIIYREFSSLSADLGYSGKVLYSVSNNTDKHYRTVEIPKGNGETRKLQIPDKLLKTVQSAIAEKLLAFEEISPYATAYRPGGSTKINASAHTGKPLVVKLDIRHFFDSIIYPQIKEYAFPAEKYSESNRILLSLLCTYKDSLPQGAPTSPVISNIIMKDFDNAVGKWCEERSVSFTRYCDDMTFSGDFDSQQLIAFVKNELKKYGFFLNSKKTVAVRQGQRQKITGIVVNNKISVPAEYKKKIRQEMYYCKKFGVESHIERISTYKSKEEYISYLSGRINYVFSVEPDNDEFAKYKKLILKMK